MIKTPNFKRKFETILRCVDISHTLKMLDTKTLDVLLAKKNKSNLAFYLNKLVNMMILTMFIAQKDKCSSKFLRKLKRQYIFLKITLKTEHEKRCADR